MMPSSRPLDARLAALLDAAVARIMDTRRTFTDAEALQAIWNAGYDFGPQEDARFALVAERIGLHRRHWRLITHTVANERLLDALRARTWDGRDLDGLLAAWDTADGVHYVYCPTDPRFTTAANGALEPSDSEQAIPLPPATRTALAALETALLEFWRAVGVEPWTTRAITERLSVLGWSDADQPNAWLLVRAWLLEWAAIARIGSDYWIPADALPAAPDPPRLAVLPVFGNYLPADDGPAAPDSSAPDSPALPAVPPLDLSSGAAGGGRTHWTILLRTQHLVHGVLLVPAGARHVYPPRPPGSGSVTALPALWFTTGDKFWLWLDRDANRLYGPALADQLAGCEAGDLLRVEWTPTLVALRLVGHDAAVQHEETRLVDVAALAALRGGVGESYRASLQVILLANPDGVPFPELLRMLEERQGHAIHRGTIRAILYASGFVHQAGRWFAAPEVQHSSRRLRTAIVDSLVWESGAIVEETAPLESRVRVINQRLSTLLLDLQK